MNNTEKSLIGFVSLIFIISILVHTILAQENETQQISPLQGITAIPQNTTFSESPQKSGITQEDILIESQRNLDRSLSILNIIAALMGVLVTILAVVIAIVGGLGFLEIKRWQENRKKIEDDAETTKKTVDFIEELRAKAESDVNVLRHEIESFPRPPLTEEPSSEVREKLAEFSHRLETLEILGVSLKPKDYITRGDDFYYKGNYELALKAYEKAIELKTDYTEAWVTAGAWVNKSAALGKLGRHDEALKAIDKAIELKPNYARAWVKKGTTLIKLNRYDEALKAFEKAIEFKPDYARAWYNRARFYSIKGDKEKALSDLKKAIELDKSYKEKAKTDKDFEKLWADADFKKIG